MDKKTLAVAFIAGLSANALLAAMTQAVVTFSLFALLTFVLSCAILYQDWVAGIHADDSGWPAVSAFVAGLITYSVMLRLEHPEIGNIIVPVLLLSGFGFWAAYRLILSADDLES